VIFFVDDSGYGDYAHHGNPTISTPNISKISQKGANFTQFYVGTADCSASRYALLTGRYPGRSGLGSWVIGPGSKRHIQSDPEGTTPIKGYTILAKNLPSDIKASESLAGRYTEAAIGFIKK